MIDQAEDLRKRLKRLDANSSTKTLAVVSGKGGVGKSNFSLNFALSLTQKGYSVLIFDMDIGMGNLDILMGRSADYTIVDFFDKKLSLKEIISEGPDGLHYIAGGTGLTRLVKLDEEIQHQFTSELSNVLGNYDYVIFDMGAGVSEDSLKFILSVNEIIVVTTPEPTSITDAYATMKYIHLLEPQIPFYIMVNRASSEKEGKETYNRLSTVLSKFLNKDTINLGMLPDDKNIQQAVKRQVPFINYNVKSPASKALLEISDRFNRQILQDSVKTNSFSFVSKLKNFLFER